MAGTLSPKICKTGTKWHFSEGSLSIKVSDSSVFMGEAAGDYRSEMFTINLLLFSGPSVSDIISS